MDTQLAIASASLVSILVTLVTLWWSVSKFRSQQKITEQQLHKQHEGMKDLARLTSQLQSDINRLSTKLGHSIKQLERVIEITRDVHLLMYGEKQTRSLEPREQGIVNTHRIELEALALVLDEKILPGLVKDLYDLIDKSWKVEGSSPFEIWEKTQIEISDASRNVCKRAVELIKQRLENAT